MIDALEGVDDVDARVIEVACGEAPFIVSRYDAESGEEFKLENRVGILDRKLRAIKHAHSRDEWLTLSLRAFQSVYGFELQPDSLMMARLNLFVTFNEYYKSAWPDAPKDDLFKIIQAQVIDAIVWNFWQMDGLEFFNDDLGDLFTEPRRKYIIKDWRNNTKGDFRTMAEKKIFDFCISNPPYQDDVKNPGDRANPLYHKFMDMDYKIADVVEIIHPARFLFNAGQTPKAWNEKMLSDPHLKVLRYEPDSKKFFRNADIKGGVAVTLRDINKNFGAIGSFSPFPELNSILQKVRDIEGEDSAYLDSVVSSRGMFRLTPLFFEDFPYASSKLGEGTGNMIVSNIFHKLPEVFLDKPPKNHEVYLKILGRVDNRRVFKFIKRAYVVNNDFIDAYKIFVPKANGSGAIGEVLSTPLIGEPLIGVTDTFICIGRYENLMEAENAFKYIKTKFARTMLGILKVTQDNPRAVWRYVPLQDFTASSDIDWSKNIPEIDAQLYAKYNLEQSEINFIESHVRSME